MSALSDAFYAFKKIFFMMIGALGLVWLLGEPLKDCPVDGIIIKLAGFSLCLICAYGFGAFDDSKKDDENSEK